MARRFHVSDGAIASPTLSVFEVEFASGYSFSDVVQYLHKLADWCSEILRFRVSLRQ